jgi:hypothetical protein
LIQQETRAALDQFFKVPLVNYFSVAGRLLSVRAADEEAAHAVKGVFSGLHLRPCAAPLGRASHHLDFETADPTPHHSPHTFEVFGGVCRDDGERFVLDLCDSRVEFDAPGRARVLIGRAAHARGAVALTTVVSTAVNTALRRCGVFVMHAAGAVEPRSGAGLLLAGPSNSGKSSLTLRLVRAGWRYLSDDTVIFYERDGRVEAGPWRRLFAVTPSALEGFEGLGASLGKAVASDPTKRRLDPAVVFPGRLAPACAPRVLCFPVIAGEAASRLEPLGPAEAMSSLIESYPWASYDATAAPAYLAALGRLVGQCRVFRLRAGRDLIDDPARAHGLLSELFDER